MQALLAAIQTRFTAASLPSTITGGLHLVEAPSGTSMPYAVVIPISAPVTQMYSATGFIDISVQFVVRAVGANAALVLCESLRDAFKNQILTLSGGQMINTILTFDAIPEPEDPIQDEQSRNTFGWLVGFSFSTTL